MKTRFLLFTLSLCFACLWGSATATVKVTNINLQKSSQFTEVTLVCDGATEYTHQIVEATANKPYRIVVDVKNAVPGLPQLAFKNLPSGSIKQIRTSQFSTDPEKVVRIVFDVAGALTYKVKGDGNTFTLQINTPSDKDFPKWSAVTGASVPTLATTKTETPAKAEVVSKPETTKKTETLAKTEVAPKSEAIKKTETLAKTEVASKPETMKKAEPLSKTEVASKPEAIKRAEPSAKTQTVATNQTPKTMPAHPDNLVTPPKATGSEAENKDLKLAAKPIDESKLLTKVNKSAPPAKTEEKAQPLVTDKASTTSDKSPVAQTKATPSPTPKAAPSAKSETKPATAEPIVADKSTTNPDKAAKASEKPASSPASNTEMTAPKRVDSMTMPQLKPTKSAPAAEPVDMAKPPKSQKTALPETKVVKSPKYTESPEAGNALTGKIATASDGNKANTTMSKPESGKDSTAAGTTISRSESVRMRYLEGKVKGITPAEATADSVEEARAAAPQTPQTEIEKIRTKYKRGIRFVQNDQDEQQQTASETDQPQESDQQSGNVGAYNEFLPEREIVVYQASGRPDPFMPLIEDAASEAKGGELPDVETLRLVGILQDKKVSRALFEDYNNYSYILKIGDRVKNGFVLSIEDTRVLFQIRQYGWNRQVAIDIENEK
jgi:hypothetical protein